MRSKLGQRALWIDQSSYHESNTITLQDHAVTKRLLVSPGSKVSEFAALIVTVVNTYIWFSYHCEMIALNRRCDDVLLP